MSSTNRDAAAELAARLAYDRGWSDGWSDTIARVERFRDDLAYEHGRHGAPFYADKYNMLNDAVEVLRNMIVESYK